MAQTIILTVFCIVAIFLVSGYMICCIEGRTEEIMLRRMEIEKLMERMDEIEKGGKE